jgi:hypothetical protein
VEATIERVRGYGQALDGAARAFLEPEFGADFSGVRRHTDGEADTLNRALSARAFTSGRDILFRQGDEGLAGGTEAIAPMVVRGVDGVTYTGEPGEELDALNTAPTIQREAPVPAAPAAPALAVPTNFQQILTGWAPGPTRYGFQLKFRCSSSSGSVADLQAQAPTLAWREYVTYSRNDFAHRIVPPSPTILPVPAVSFAAARTTVISANVLEFDGVTDTHFLPTAVVRETDFAPHTARALPAIMESTQVYQYTPDGGATWNAFAGPFTLRRTFFRTPTWFFGLFGGNLTFTTNKVGIHSVTEDYKP